MGTMDLTEHMLEILGKFLVPVENSNAMRRDYLSIIKTFIGNLEKEYPEDMDPMERAIEEPLAGSNAHTSAANNPGSVANTPSGNNPHSAAKNSVHTSKGTPAPHGQQSKKRRKKDAATVCVRDEEEQSVILRSQSGNTSKLTPTDVEEIERDLPMSKRVKITDFMKLVKGERTILTNDQMEAAYDAVREIRLSLLRKEKESKADRPRQKGDMVVNSITHFAKCFGPDGENQLRKMIGEVRTFESITNAAFSQMIDAPMAEEARDVLKELRKDTHNESKTLRNRNRQMTAMARTSKKFHHLVAEYHKKGSAVEREMTALGLTPSQGRDGRSLAYAHLLHLEFGYDPIEALASYIRKGTKGTKNLNTPEGVEVTDEDRRKMQLQKDRDHLRSRIQTGDTYLTIAEILGPGMYALLPEHGSKYYVNNFPNHSLEDVLSGLVKAVPYLPDLCRLVQSVILDKIGDDEAPLRMAIEGKSDPGKASGLLAIMESSKATATVT